MHVTDGVIAEVGPALRPLGDPEVVDGHGGALLPGLHDHHIHLLATAAARTSVAAGPPAVADRDALATALRRADATLAPGRWLRAVGYHESVAGDLDRSALDALVPGRPVRVQHRSGARWTLNSAALDALGLGDPPPPVAERGSSPPDVERAPPRPADERDAPPPGVERDSPPPGVERDAAGRPTGRLHRSDDWLRDRLPADGPPDLAGLGTALRRLGVTGVTDATPYRRLADLDALAAAADRGDLPQHLVATGGHELAGADFPSSLGRGPVKVIIDDAAYPGLDALAHQISTAHQHHRPVAIHCVTRTALALALAAWDTTGARPGDRIEHGSVIPPEMLGPIAAHGLTVVTQPGFVAERGDRYLADVDADDLPHLYPCRRLLAAGIPVAGSTDAPYTAIDPWAAMRAAVHRATPSGATVAPREAVAPARALGLFLGSPGDPGGPRRRVEPGSPADLLLLGLPLAAALGRLDAEDVVWTHVGRARRRT